MTQSEHNHSNRFSTKQNMSLKKLQLSVFFFRGRFARSQPTSNYAQDKDIKISADVRQHMPEDARFFLILS